MAPAPHPPPRPPPRPALSSSAGLLALIGLFLLALPLMWVWPSPMEASPSTIPVTLSAEPARDGGRRPSISEMLGEIEREPLEAVADSGLAKDWIVIPEPESAAPAPGATTVAAGEGEGAAAVAGYLQAMEHALMTGGYWSDPHQLAQTVLAEMVQGETGGLRRLRESTAGVRRRVQAIRPPPGCAAHHRRTLEVLDQGVELVASLEGAMQAQDLAAIAAATAQAERLQAGAAEVDAMTAELRLRAGL